METLYYKLVVQVVFVCVHRDYLDAENWVGKKYQQRQELFQRFHSIYFEGRQSEKITQIRNTVNMYKRNKLEEISLNQKV